jgi:hypothetical protein
VRGAGAKSSHDSCNECGVIHRLSTACPDASVPFDDGGIDIMDPPDLFSGLYDEDEPPRMPQERRSGGGAPIITIPRIKDASIRLPGGVMFSAQALAAERGDVITSGREGYSGDGVHAATSQHYEGAAIDVRWGPDRRAQAQAYADAGYIAIPEATHLHVQRYAA